MKTLHCQNYVNITSNANSVEAWIFQKLPKFMLVSSLCLDLVFVLFSPPTVEGRPHFSFFNLGSDRPGIYSFFYHSALDNVEGF